MSGIKIQLGTENQAEIMQLLGRFGDHKQVCDECERAMKAQTGHGYCQTGFIMLKELASFPEVQPFNDGDKQ